MSIKPFLKKHTLALGIGISLLTLGGVVVGAQYLNQDSQTPVTNQATISEEKAKSIAGKHTGISDLTFQYLTLERDHNSQNPHYEIKALKDGVEYEFDIDAITGQVLNYSTENKSSTNSFHTANSTATPSLDQEAIKTIVEEATQEKGLTYAYITLTTENGLPVYDVKATSTQSVYDLEIDANSGKILSSEQENLSSKTAQPNFAAKMSETEIKTIVGQTTGITDLTFTEISLSQEADEYKGNLIYEVTAYGSGTEYELDIDANTGQILKSSAERDDD